MGRSRATDRGLFFFFSDLKRWQRDLNSDKPVPLQGIDVFILVRGSLSERLEDLDRDKAGYTVSMSITSP